MIKLKRGPTARTVLRPLVGRKNNEEKGGCSKASQLEEGINETLNEAVGVEQPGEEENSDFLDFEEEDLDGVPDEDDSEVDEELREVELGEAGVDKGFEDIFKNKIEKYTGKLGGDEEFIGSSDEPSEDSDEELDVLA
ncbi:hypothetical protein HAX54_044701 [Datura stramonium]|uniref:Uncharacterized protein n=1 Tax=Datura stramonium TaxID=4076 RepID=A0ABS8SPS3_DATST|nr:hypothetical protein [Datura stramonium]